MWGGRRELANWSLCKILVAICTYLTDSFVPAHFEKLLYPDLPLATRSIQKNTATLIKETVTFDGTLLLLQIEFLSCKSMKNVSKKATANLKSPLQ